MIACKLKQPHSLSNSDLHGSQQIQGKGPELCNLGSGKHRWGVRAVQAIFQKKQWHPRKTIMRKKFSIVGQMRKQVQHHQNGAFKYTVKLS